MQRWELEIVCTSGECVRTKDRELFSPHVVNEWEQEIENYMCLSWSMGEKQIGNSIGNFWSMDGTRDSELNALQLVNEWELEIGISMYCSW